MPNFKIHSIAQSSGARKKALEAVNRRYGSLPNVIGGMAESPAALNGYIGLIDAMRQTSFSNTELHVIWFTINVAHSCHYCMSAHSQWAEREGVSQDVIETARTGSSYKDERLEALRTFTQIMVEERGWAGEKAIDAFLMAGFTRENIFEIIAAIAYKVMTNYTNHIVEPELDELYCNHRWSKEDLA